jgi:diguanylate cyclase (GGDEF)-like protein
MARTGKIVSPHVGFRFAERTLVSRVLRPRARRRLLHAVLVLSVLSVGGAVTTVATVQVGRAHRQIGKEAMDRAIQDVTDGIKDEVGHYAAALDDTAAAMGAQPELTATGFRQLTTTINRNRLPGAATVAFVVPAYDAQVARTQARWRARGAGGLSLYRTGADVEHMFIIFGRALTGPEVASGRDLSQTRATEDALRTARSTRAFTVGGAHIAVRDRQQPIDKQQMSVTLAQPVLGLDGAFRGWLVMQVRGRDFLGPVLDRRVHGTVRVQLVDLTGRTTHPIVALAGGDPLDEPTLNRGDDIEVGQHTWHLSLQPTTDLLGGADTGLIWVTPLTGGAITLLLTLLVGVLAGAHARAEGKVEEATAALREDIAQREVVEEQLRHSEAELQHLAYHDQLTGLANRGLFYDRVAHALQTHARDRATFAVFFLDLDGFKQVNDELGHGAGDAVLRETAARLQTCLRESDTVARFGGDEFAVVAERLADPADIHVTAGRIVAAMRHPIHIGRRAVTVTASVGIALNRPGDTADDMLRAADLAMYRAKTSGKSRHVLSGS